MCQSESPPVPSKKTQPGNSPRQPAERSLGNEPAGADLCPAATSRSVRPREREEPDGAWQWLAQRPCSLRQHSMESCAKPSGLGTWQTVSAPWRLRRGLDAVLSRGLLPGLFRSSWAKIALNPASGFTEASADSEHLPAIGNDIVALWEPRNTIRPEDFWRPRGPRAIRCERSRRLTVDRHYRHSRLAQMTAKLLAHRADRDPGTQPTT
jgi:hypothetical protein